MSLPPGICEVSEGVPATLSSQTASSPSQEHMEAIDLSALTAQEQGKVRSLLQKYKSVFSAHEGDLGCTNLISHHIPLVDDTPV